MMKSFSKFSGESSIHALNYIGKTNLHWIERLFWISAFLFSLTTCSFLIHQTYKKWDDDPVLATFNERSTPMWRIPFPALTICGDSKTSVEELNLTSVIEKVKKSVQLSAKESAGFEALYQICELDDYAVDTSSIDYVATLRGISNKFPEKSFASKSSVDSINYGKFTEYFKEVITEQGICYSYNMLDEKDLYKDIMNPNLRFPKHGLRTNWTIFGYDKKTDPIMGHPTRVYGSGLKAGVEIRLVSRKKDDNQACNPSFNGFRIALHTPDEIPDLSSHFYRIPPNAETYISVKPRVLSTSENLRRYRPKKRLCYFKGEKDLKYFKAYTAGNCKLECITEFVLNKCGCVRFSMPHVRGTKMCNRKEIKCVKDSEFKWRLNEYIKGLAQDADGDEIDHLKHTLNQLDPESTRSTDIFKSCECLPACSSIQFDAEISQMDIDYVKYSRTKGVERFEGDYVSFVAIYFKDDNFIESRRSELYGWGNFLSSCGGFLGLLMGGSLLSLVEIFYHLTLRNIFKRRIKIVDLESSTSVTPQTSQMDHIVMTNLY